MLKRFTTFLVIIIAWAIVVGIFIAENKHTVVGHDKREISSLVSAYRYAFYSIENHSRLFFNTVISQKSNTKIIQTAIKNKDKQDTLRKQLYDKLSVEFAMLQKVGFGNIGFTLPDGTVFLRMNTPDFFGDRIDEKRPLVKQVVQTRKYAVGFEVGKILTGFTFCYPLISDGEFVGTVFISISAKTFTSMMNENFHGKFNFIISKEALNAVMFKEHSKLYQDSVISDKFVRDNSFEPDETIQEANKKFASQTGHQELSTLIAKVFHISTSKQPVGMILLPIKTSSGKLDAFLVGYQNDTAHANMQNELLVKILLVSVLFMLLLLGAYKRQKLYAAQLQAQQELELQRTQMQSILDGAPSMIFIKDQQHRFVFGNKAFCDFMGCSFAELHGKSDPDFLPKEEANRIWGDDDKIIKNRVLLQYEESVSNSQGSLRFLMTSKQAFTLENGEVGILAIATDITERHEARRTSAMLRKFFDNTTEGMIISDRNGIIKSVNPAFTKITGYEASEVIGKKPSILQSGVHGNDFYTKMWQEILANGRWEGEVCNRRKNGETYPEWLTITQIKGEDGKIENFIAITLDMTQMKKDQEKINEQDKMIIAQSRFAAMGEMISMIAHQWRQPITAIGMGANNMIIDIELGSIDEEVFRKHLEFITQQVQFLSHTIDDFRNFFKPNREITQVYVSQLIEATMKIISKSLESNNITCTVNTDFNPKINIHEGEMTQVLLSLIGNAKDALVERGIKPAHIAVRSVQNTSYPDMIELQIEDNGGGIPEDIKQKIFEPYFTTKEAKNGTGLGLYIAKSIIEKHQNGTIWVENTNDGACFFVRLPLSQGDEK